MGTVCRAKKFDGKEFTDFFFQQTDPNWEQTVRSQGLELLHEYEIDSEDTSVYVLAKKGRRIFKSELDLPYPLSERLRVDYLIFVKRVGNSLMEMTRDELVQFLEELQEGTLEPESAPHDPDYIESEGSESDA